MTVNRPSLQPRHQEQQQNLRALFKRGYLWDILNHGGLILVALVFLFPLFWMVSNAIRPNKEVLAVPPRILPSHAEWGNFIETWFHLPFGQFFLNSFIVAGGVTAITLVVSCLAGYAFARLDFFGRQALFLTYVATLMIPQAMLVIPLFLIVSKIGWINSYHGMILPMAFSSFGTFLMRQFFLSIPKELEEAAKLDGAGYLRILLTIILPLSLPAVGLVALFTFISQWNNFLWPLIVTNSPDYATLPLGLTMFKTQQGTAWNYIMAGATLSMIPGIILAIILQQLIYRGITIGSGFGGR